MRKNLLCRFNFHNDRVIDSVGYVALTTEILHSRFGFVPVSPQVMRGAYGDADVEIDIIDFLTDLGDLWRTDCQVLMCRRCGAVRNEIQTARTTLEGLLASHIAARVR